MKVLIACNKDSYKNPFVRTLADGIAAQGIDVTCSLHDFWHEWEKYDIIHLQWPNILISGQNSVEPLRSHLQKIKDAKIPLVITVHNLVPHYTNDEIINKAYKLVYSMMDYFIHMGTYSLEVLEKEYPDARHCVIPHHIYDTLYQNIPNRQEAIKQLHLNPNMKYILCFGAFRNNEERDMVDMVARTFKDRGYRILAPGFSRCQIRKRIYMTIKDYFLYLYRKIKYPYIIFTSKFIEDSDLPFYYSASDIAFIHRKKILNSGNLPMAMMMGKVVVGPNEGNVGKLLCQTNNPVFQVENMQSILESIESAISLNCQGKGDKNRDSALKTFSLMKIAFRYKELYYIMLND